MSPPVNPIRAYWFAIEYGPHREIVVCTGTSLQAVMDRISASQAGRLAYTPNAPRITRISVLRPPPLDRAFAEFLDECLRRENTQAYKTV